MSIYWIFFICEKSHHLWGFSKVLREKLSKWENNNIPHHFSTLLVNFSNLQKSFFSLSNWPFDILFWCRVLKVLCRWQSIIKFWCLAILKTPPLYPPWWDLITAFNLFFQPKNKVYFSDLHENFLGEIKVFSVKGNLDDFLFPKTQQLFCFCVNQIFVDWETKKQYSQRWFSRYWLICNLKSIFVSWKIPYLIQIISL